MHQTDPTSAARICIPSAFLLGRDKSCTCGICSVWVTPFRNLSLFLCAVLWSSGPGRSRFCLPVQNLQPFHQLISELAFLRGVFCAWALEMMRVLLESIRTKCCHLPPLSWEPETGSCQRVQDAHLFPWQICHEFCHPQKNPVPLKHAGCCKRPPCCEKACQVWVWCIKASTRLGKEKTWFSGCCRMICNWNSKGRTMFRVAGYCCYCSVFRELLAEVFNGMSLKQLTF